MTLFIWLVFISLIVHRYTCTANACITMHLCNSTLIAGSCALQNWLTLSWRSSGASVRTTHLSKGKGYIQSETDNMELAIILTPIALSTILYSILFTIMCHFVYTFYFPHKQRYVWELLGHWYTATVIRSHSAGQEWQLYTNSLQIAADTPGIDGNTQCRETDEKIREWYEASKI